MNGPWPAPAKLNLFLHIVGRRADGYHLLQTVFQFIDLCDHLHFAVRRDGRIRRLNELPGVASEDDLTVRAARLLQHASACALGVDIRVEKRLPMGGGLGGGSSNAATTLHALNHLWRLEMSRQELLALALRLGADVPVFVHGEAVWAGGVGERFQPLAPPEPWYVVIAPGCSIPTAEIFQVPELTRDCQVLTIDGFLSGQGGNVFEPVVRRRYPVVAQALDWLGRYAPARLSGTGACVFAAFDEERQARSVWRQVPEEWQGFVARGMNRSPLLLNE
ncbi:MAG: 4-(cytidine 5'-diphospho)-2-C-methyl-D-erythritol kinase [Gammaproteobacteria bacterium]